MKFTWLYVFTISYLTLSASRAFAAYPISQDYSKEILVKEQITQLPGYGGNPHSEDQGIFGILALIFAVTGLFPFAIASGIIGTQNGRKFKGLARAGLLFGILVGFVFVCYIFYRTVLL